MSPQDILAPLGQFSAAEVAMFEKLIRRRVFQKGDILLHASQVCQSVFFILSGSFTEYEKGETDDKIIDLHVRGEWMFNRQSFSEQLPSQTVIETFSTSEVIELGLHDLHRLIAGSQAFLQLGRIFSQGSHRVFLFDQDLNPAQKYAYILKAKPSLLQSFPLKLIAAYLKLSPETLSRVRAKAVIS